MKHAGAGDILRAVALEHIERELGVTYEEIMAREMHPKIVDARVLYTAVLYEIGRMSFPEIQRLTSGRRRGHSTAYCRYRRWTTSGKLKHGAVLDAIRSDFETSRNAAQQ